MSTIQKEYSVQNPMTLVIDNLRMASVTVKPGKPGQALVILSGRQDLLDQIQVEQEAKDLVAIRGKGNGNSGTTVISDGATVISGNGTIISFGGGKFNISNRGNVEGMIIGNDVSITQHFGMGSGQQTTVIRQSELPTIEVIVPQGTTLDIGDVKSLKAQGVNGKLIISSSHQSQVEVEEACDVMAVCSGQSSCKITKARGTFQATISGQSAVHVNGSLGVIAATVSGQSKCTVKGSCTQATLIARGQSYIGFMSKCSGKVTKRTSGQSDIADFND